MIPGGSTPGLEDAPWTRLVKPSNRQLNFAFAGEPLLLAAAGAHLATSGALQLQTPTKMLPLLSKRGLNQHHHQNCYTGVCYLDSHKSTNFSQQRLGCPQLIVALQTGGIQDHREAGSPVFPFIITAWADECLPETVIGNRIKLHL